MSKLLIVDGHAYAYRAFYAIRNMKSAKGSPTNAIFGFVKMLTKMRAALKPTHLIVVWDGGLSSHRTEALPGYKAQRPSMPDELACQLDEIGSYLKAAGVPAYCADGVEADDYIAFLALHGAAEGFGTWLRSNSKSPLSRCRALRTGTIFCRQRCSWCSGIGYG